MLKTPFGLGDLAYYLFRPAVYFIDWTHGSDMRHCEVCKARRARWNALFSMPRWAWFLFAVTTLGLVVWWGK